MTDSWKLLFRLWKIAVLNLNDVHMFVQVVKYGGMTAAAKATAIPTSTLSKRLSALEESLGVRLVQRTSRAFKVTDLGLDFYRHATAMLIEAESAECVVRGHLTQPKGTVRITASVTTAQMSLARLLPELAEAYPAIQLVLHATDRFVDIVEEGFDIAVRAHFRPLPDAELSHKRLGSAPNLLVASEEYFSAFGYPSAPTDLVNHYGLLSGHAASARGWRLHSSKGEEIEVNPRPRFFADDPSTLINAAVRGLGIACLPSGLCQPFLDNGSLRLAIPDWYARGATITLLMPSRRGQMPAVKAVVDFLADRIIDVMRLT